MKRALLAMGMLAGLAAQAAAEERFALVIGNGAYETVRPLDASAADAALIAGRLEEVGFTVTLHTDLDLAGMRTEIAAFGKAMRSAAPEDLALIYFAGHGMSDGDEAYLLPVDADISDAADLDFVAVELDAVLAQLASGQTANAVAVIDCCGDNPFPDIIFGSSTGLGAVETPESMLVMLASEAGATRPDPLRPNGALALALAEALGMVDTDLGAALAEVSATLAGGPGGAPWIGGALAGEVKLIPLTPEQRAELALFEAGAESGAPLDLMAYLTTYPEGAYAQEAKRMLADALQQELVALEAAAEAAPEAEAGDTPEVAADLPVIGAEAEATAEGDAEPALPEIAAPDAADAADAEALPEGAESATDLADARSVGDEAARLAREQALIETAQVERTIEAYRAYLDAFPDGLYAELAELEIAALEAAETAQPLVAPAQ